MSFSFREAIARDRGGLLVLSLKDVCLHAAILLQFRYTASVKKADKLNPRKPRKGDKTMSDTPKP